MTLPGNAGGATDSFVTFCEAIQAIIESVKEEVTPAIADIWYGDQQQLPRTPTVCIVADGKRRELSGAPRRMMNTLTCYVVVYHSKIQDVQMNSKESDKLAEQLETAIHADPTLGGLVIHCYVTQVDAGQSTKYVNTTATMYRSTRLTVEGISKTMLPMSPGYNS